jgi:hypothetical protein
VVSPLVLPVARHGLERALGIAYTPQGVLRGTDAWVRSADDRAGVCPTREKAIAARAILRAWLRMRG